MRRAPATSPLSSPRYVRRRGDHRWPVCSRAWEMGYVVIGSDGDRGDQVCFRAR